MRKDWTGLTAEQHRQSLIEDALDGRSAYAAQAALQRLYFYYPNAADPIATKLLARPWPGFVDAATERNHVYLIEGLSNVRSAKLDEAIVKVFQSLDLKRHKESDRIDADHVAVACMDRLIGKGMDAEFRVYCEQRIRELEQKQRGHAEDQRLEALHERLRRIGMG